MFLSTLHTIGLIILVILFFNVMIFVHELGHFLAGKWRGAYIDRFQIWFGKPLWKKKIGGVQWGIGWIPAGGFVSLPQMEDMESIEGNATLPQEALKPLSAPDKVIIAAAGPLFSLLLAYVFAIIVFFIGKPVMDVQGTTIGLTLPDSPAAQAGLMPGDRILAVDGQKVEKWMGNMEGVRELVAMSDNETIRFTVSRPQPDGSERVLDIESSYTLPETKWWQRGGLRSVGILPTYPCKVGSVIPNSPAERAGLREGDEILTLNGQAIYAPQAVLLAAENMNPMQLTLRHADGSQQAVSLAAETPANWQGKEGAHPILGFIWQDERTKAVLEHPTPQQQVNQSLKFMGDTLAKLITPGSSVGMEHLSGPVGIGNYMYRMMESGDGMGWRLVLWFAVVLNVNLAVLNILPLPVVDGGHVVLGIVEMIRRKPVNGQFLNWIFSAFIVLMLAFFVFVTFKDVGDMLTPEEKGSKLPAPEFSAPSE